MVEENRKVVITNRKSECVLFFCPNLRKEGNRMKVKRGDILYVDLGSKYQGSVQGGTRPVIVISNNRANKYSTVITVVPLSSHISKKRNLPTHVFVSAYRSTGLNVHSMALCEQVMSVDKVQIIGYIGKMDAGTLEQVTRAVQVQIDGGRSAVDE